jgi:hypothetical protein
VKLVPSTCAADKTMAQDHFAKFTEFDYDRTLPLLKELWRLAVNFHWPGGGLYSNQREECLGLGIQQLLWQRLEDASDPNSL